MGVRTNSIFSTDMNYLFIDLQVKSSRLDTLQSKYTSMTSEIRHLDSDMQARSAG